MHDRTPNARQLTEAERIDRLRLIRSDNVGPRTFRSLLDHFGDARAALERLPDLARRGGAARSGRICSEDDATRRARREPKDRRRLVAPGEAGYPPRLATLDDAPPLLGVRGAPRRADAADDRDRRLAQCLRRRAEIRRPAGARSRRGRLRHHLGAGARHRSGRASRQLASGTVAVLAGGHDRIYPPEHDDLLAAILEHGRLRSPKCRSAMCRAPAIFPAATG